MAGAVSIAVHVLLVLLAPVIISLNNTGEIHRRDAANLHDAAHLIAPLTDFTQKEPTHGPISKQMNAEQLEAKMRVPTPATPPPSPRPRFEMPTPPAPAAAPQALPEPPRIDAQTNAAVNPMQGVPNAPPAPPPQIQPVEKPKLAFERVGASPMAPSSGTARLAPPSSNIDDISRGIARGGGTSGGQMVGDVESGTGLAAGAGTPRSAPRNGSNLELKSDPMGVDFRPYLLRILTTVRRNWQAVIPESVRLGRRGRVILLLAINRDGTVPKLVIDASSGIDALDRAAVAGVSASNPFPPLPPEFKGSQIRVQFSFVYNMH